jgi:hypothetical protein
MPGAEQHRHMARDENISADTSGRTGDVGGSTSGGKAGDDPLNALKTGTSDPSTPVADDDAGADQLHGTPDDLKPGRRRTIGMDPDAGAGSDVPGSTASD